ncbi:VCBS repeat-containing protein, partial [Streptomyces sp. NPDC093252]
MIFKRLTGVVTSVLLAVGLLLLAPSAAQAVTGAFTPFGIADWDRDGRQDIITRNDTTGDLWLYPG